MLRRSSRIVSHVRTPLFRRSFNMRIERQQDTEEIKELLKEIKDREQTNQRFILEILDNSRKQDQYLLGTVGQIWIVGILTSGFTIVSLI